MKLSLAWIFDYIQGDYSNVDVPQLVNKFNQTTAEIEQYYKVELDLNNLSLAHLESFDATSAQVKSPEWGDITLPFRPDLRSTGQLFLIKRTGVDYVWATSLDLGARKIMGLPPLFCEDRLIKGGWKKEIESKDWVIDIDNKSINNRPDLWSHRGIAREIAAILNLPFKSWEHFLAKKDCKEFGDQKKARNTFCITNDVPQACKRFAGLWFEFVEFKPSLIPMTSRLSRVDSKAISALVDMTNYVMLDIGQPMHAFDAHKIPTQQIVVRMAKNREKLTLLDDQTISLTADDLIISDGPTPLALAGIMGGKPSSVTEKTTSIFLEAACFNATTIRRSSVQTGIRTESSARFEKSLDPNQNVLGILRFLKLIQRAKIDVKEADYILSLGERATDKEIKISQAFIENRLGTTVSSDFIIKTLQKIGFKVEYDQGDYTIFVPPFRSSKDVRIKEDIVEEVGRFFGYDAIPYILPERKMAPFDISGVMRTRSIKKLMAYGLQMREIQPYAFFDEEFLKTIVWRPEHAVCVKNPISANWAQLVTTLVPSLLKSVYDHRVGYDQLRFFEWGRIWRKEKKVIEGKRVSGIFYKQKEPVSFYDSKALLSHIFELLNMEVQWGKVEQPMNPWFDPYKTASITHKGERVGIAGKVNKLFFESVALGDAFIFELDAQYLLQYQSSTPVYVPATKYPAVERDISMLVPLEVTVEQIITLINTLDKRIVSTQLIDFFQQDDWKNKKSITVRFVVRDKNKTMTKDEIDALSQNVTAQLAKLGALVR